MNGWETITLSTDSNNPTIMQYDGFIRVYYGSTGEGGDGSDLSIFINGIKFTDYKNVVSQYNMGMQLLLPINKGDSVYYKATRVSNGTLETKGNYYKKRDYSNR